MRSDSVYFGREIGFVKRIWGEGGGGEIMGEVSEEEPKSKAILREAREGGEGGEGEEGGEGGFINDDTAG